MIPLYTIITFTFLHWVFDFFLQTDSMAKGKSHSFKHLADHVGMYSVGLIAMGVANLTCFHVNFALVFGWIIFNAFAHFFTDYVTSRASSLLWKEQNFHDFFVVVGIDQFIHYATLFASFYYISNL
jgi:hypothetical protein